jgi:hypothetical protein
MRVQEIILSEAAPFDDDDDAMDEHPNHSHYTTGYCHALALAIHEKTGYHMVALEAREGRRWVIIHVMIDLDDDEYLEIGGIKRLNEILDDANIDEFETKIRVVEVKAGDIPKMTRRGMVALTPEVMAKAREAADWAIDRNLERRGSSPSGPGKKNSGRGPDPWGGPRP